MFFIGVFGINRRSKILEEIEFKCTGCLNGKVDLIETYSSFEIFFIPVYRYNRRYILACKRCKSLYSIKDERIEEVLNIKKANYEDVEEVIHQNESCPNCNSVVEKRYEYCPKCGKKL